MAETLPEGFLFRSMFPEDVRPAVSLIADHDSDDGAEAKRSYARGLEDQYVLDFEGRLVGVTGVRYAEETDRTYWLSWTYLDEEFRGQGFGQRLFDCLFEILEAMEVRKLFVSTSDYADHRGEIYAPAMALYRKNGLQEEVRIFDYHGEGESLLIFGKLLEPHRGAGPTDKDLRQVELKGLHPIDGTRGSYVVDWTYSESRGSGPEDLERAFRKAPRKARMFFASCPSDQVAGDQLFRGAGMQEVGRLRDFFETGVDDVQFSLERDRF